jgi:uroporphyrinogen III methyltransferase / synthase
MNARGTVYLVGAGPGDPDLLTLRAADLLRRADAVVYDALVHPAVVERCPADTRRIYVGDQGGEDSAPQEEVGRMLRDLAESHGVVVRLKGGDPFIFGRGGEEALALVEAGVPFEIVPGVTAGTAAAAYAGIPVTHGGLASSVTLVTGQEEAVRELSDVDWEALACRGGTVLFYMGVSQLEHNLARLVDAGRSSDTPAAVVQWGTFPRQRTITGTLATLAARAREAGIGAPAVVIVGEVVALRDQLRWFERRPLFGRRVVVTRARAQAAELVSRLAALGAEVVPFPTIRIVPPEDRGPLLRAAGAIDGYDWLVLTSVNAVANFWGALREMGRDTRSLAGVSICAIGPATAAAIEMEGARADLVPPEYHSDSVARAMTGEVDLTGARVLLPQAEAARPIIARSMVEAGAEVDAIIAYRTVPDLAEVERVRRLVLRDEIDVLTFTAGSTVRNFVDAMGTDVGSAQIACIGPATSAVARELGLRVDVEAGVHTVPGLVDALVAHFVRTSAP